jgi:HEPN domain-containing protein
MANRHRDWLRQAEADLRHARHALDDGDYDWACFAAQQSAEKAVKGTILLGSLADRTEVPGELLDAGRRLDKHYIPTRYPNGFDAGAPTDYYTREEAEAAVRDADAILGFSHGEVG